MQTQTVVKKQVAGLFGINVLTSKEINVVEGAEYRPKHEHYIFEEVVLKKLLFWLSPFARIKNVMILGQEGTGKTSLLTQFGERLGREVFSISCSGKTRLEHLIGTLTIDASGKTVFVDGPLTMAYRRGGIFLANELTRMDPGEQMRLVDALDNNSRLTITATGEQLSPHPEFRFAATGNSGGFGDESGAYNGEKVASTAFFKRFIKIELNGMSLDDEIKYIGAILGDAKIAKDMVQFAADVRKDFIGRNGGCRINISQRDTTNWAYQALEYKKMKLQNNLKEALNDVVLNGTPEDDRKMIEIKFDKLFKIGPSI
jgi:cobaltochelatase CobS